MAARTKEKRYKNRRFLINHIYVFGFILKRNKIRTGS